jgi:microcystin-dependent protein
MDAMPGGGRANRMTRAVAIVIAGRTGEEVHVITQAEMANHTHSVNLYDPGHDHWIDVFEHMYQGAADQSTHDFAGPPNYENGAHAKPNTTGIQVSLNSAGGSAAHENVQPTVFIPYIVCLTG